jgi:hypothetical protein
VVFKRGKQKQDWPGRPSCAGSLGMPKSNGIDAAKSSSLSPWIVARDGQRTKDSVY